MPDKLSQQRNSEKSGFGELMAREVNYKAAGMQQSHLSGVQLFSSLFGVEIHLPSLKKWSLKLPAWQRNSSVTQWDVTSLGTMTDWFLGKTDEMQQYAQE